jgi:hypothetical protein
MIEPVKLSPGYRYAQALYNSMLTMSEVVSPRDLLTYGFPVDSDDQEPVTIYKGYVYTAARAVPLKSSQQNNSMTLLKAMRAITLVRHGATTSPAVYMLNFYPSDEICQKFRDANTSLVTSTMPRRIEIFTRDIAELRMRVQKLESAIDELKTRLNL